MDFSVLKTNSSNAFKYYKFDDTKFKKSMGDFYREGIENPSVAKVIFEEQKSNTLSNIRKAHTEFIEQTKNLPDNGLYGNIYADRLNTDYSTGFIGRYMDIHDINESKSLKEIPEKEAFDKEFEKLYPKTGAIRKKIIETGRLKSDQVVPKMSWTYKYMNIRSTGELQRDYPKTNLVRSCLILDGQIKDGEVTPRAKGFFNRLSYKALLVTGAVLNKLRPIRKLF